jgi:hypothetical protein
MKIDAKNSNAMSIRNHSHTISINLKGSATVLKSFKVSITEYPCILIPSKIPWMKAVVNDQKEKDKEEKQKVTPFTLKEAELSQSFCGSITYELKDGDTPYLKFNSATRELILDSTSRDDLKDNKDSTFSHKVQAYTTADKSNLAEAAFSVELLVPVDPCSLAINDCCQGLKYLEAGAKSSTKLSTDTKKEVITNLELDFVIGEDKEKVLKNEISSINCEASVLLKAPEISVAGVVETKGDSLVIAPEDVKLDGKTVEVKLEYSL